MLKMDLYISAGGQTKMQGWLESLLQGDKWDDPHTAVVSTGVRGQCASWLDLGVAWWGVLLSYRSRTSWVVVMLLWVTTMVVVWGW